jgi:hypothetical protein
MKSLEEWVIIKYVDNKLLTDTPNKIEIWRDYNYIWGSALYEVLGYFTGSYIDARKYSKTLKGEI